MVCFKDVVSSKRDFLRISDNESSSSKEVHLRTFKALTGHYSDIWPKLTNPLHQGEWSRKSDDAKSSGLWILHSAHHRYDDDISILETLGRRIIAKKTEWGDSINFLGDFRYIPGYWEWTEDILSRYKSELQRVEIYDSVYASLFTYDSNPEIVKAFCEAWCSSTNTLLTSQGEVSISLWDLYVLSGLPIDGSFFDEVVPTAEELTGVDHARKSYLPICCNHLLHAFFHIKPRSRQVTFEDWIKFWSKKTLRYTPPPIRTESKKKVRSKSTHNPTGDVPSCGVRTSIDNTPFLRLSLKEEHHDTAYLAAYISCWLCCFVLPEGEHKFIRPETFKMASLMACGRKACLTVPVLAKIYRGLNIISKSPDPPSVRVTLPFHFIHGWMALYLKTHFPCDPKRQSTPKMIQFSGEGGARSYNSCEAHRRIFKADNLSWTCNMYTTDEDIPYIDEDLPLVHERDLFMSIRSNFLTLRVGDCFIVEPYSPHRFSRQFGFYQTVPGIPRWDIRDASLEDGLQYWRICVLRRTMSKACFPRRPTNTKGMFSPGYAEWWEKVYGHFLTLHGVDLYPTKPKVVRKIVLKEKVVQPHNIDSPSKRREVNNLLDDSASNNDQGSVDMNWKRTKYAKSPSHCSVNSISVEGVRTNSNFIVPDASIDSAQVMGPPRHRAECHYQDIGGPSKPATATEGASVVSEFHGDAVLDSFFKKSLREYWHALRAKLLKTNIKYLSTLHDDTFRGFDRMEKALPSVDISHLRSEMESIFINAAMYDNAKSASVEPSGDELKRMQELNEHISHTKVMIGEDASRIETTKKRIAELEAELKFQVASLEECTSTHLADQAKLGDLEKELSKITDAATEEARENLTSLESTLKDALRSLEDVDPFA